MRINTPIKSLSLSLLACMIWSCSESDEYFQLLTPTDTGVTFVNEIIESESLNILDFHYLYNGGGVGVGDFNNDELPDLVFSGNQKGLKIYLNQGGFKFKDITSAGDIVSSGWLTGLSIVDINADGLDDIYVSVGGLNCIDDCDNLLYINEGLDDNGVVKFVEQAKDYGLNDGLYTQQTAFLDYDLDGDLDAFLLHNVIDKKDKNAPYPKRYADPRSMDHLLRNDYDSIKGHPVYVNVSEESGISERGYGLGVAVDDFNNDGLPDIYVSNDFISDDDLYMNKGDGSFEEKSASILKHQSYNAMGVDVADLNDDGLSDIVVLDMLPDYHERQKTMIGVMNYNKYRMMLREGYVSQYVRNTLQRNNGYINNEMHAMSEIGYMSGIYKTDWSWAPLLADYDNDGKKDLYITNGYGKDITDLDFISYTRQSSAFGGMDLIKKRQLEAIKKMTEIRMPNYLYRNTGSFQFEDVSHAWIGSEKSISNGAVYVDLDLDGRLDIVTNNINAPAYIMKNNIGDNNYLRIKLKGSIDNPKGIGAVIEIWSQGKKQRLYNNPTRGYLSSVDPILHFGVGQEALIDSVIVTWPRLESAESRVSFLTDVVTNQVALVDYKNSAPKNEEPDLEKEYLFVRKDDVILKKHSENDFVDFDKQPLLLTQQSFRGACVTSSIIDEKTGSSYLYVGGAYNDSSAIYIIENAEYVLHQVIKDDFADDIDAFFSDIDNDGDQDLFVLSGGAEFLSGDHRLSDRIYLQGDDQLFYRDEKFDNLSTNNAGTVAPNDYDKDGYVDIFIGSSSVPGSYPQSTKSVLFKNAKGVFKAHAVEGLMTDDLVTSAVWSDVNNDGWDDLVLVGEWMPITIYYNDNGELSVDPYVIENTHGLWTYITSADLDEDGDQDLVVGNLGSNTMLSASIQNPLLLSAADIDNNGSVDPLIGKYQNNKAGDVVSYPIHSRDNVMGQLPHLKNKYQSYSDFASANFEELVGTDKTLKAELLLSVVIRNNGTAGWSIEPLPNDCQVSPVQDIVVEDINNDGRLDIVIAGNDYRAESNGGRHDASNGVLLLADENYNYNSVSSVSSGWYVPNDNRDIEIVTFDGYHHIIVMQNNDYPAVFEVKRVVSNN